jgi:hypothetical protein
MANTKNAKNRKRASLRSRISVNMFRGAVTPAEVRNLLKFHRIGIHPNKYVTESNRKRATEQTHKLTLAANKRLDEIQRIGRRFSRPGAARNMTRSRSGRQGTELPWMFALK